ncbi:peptidase M56 family protein [Arthrobacter sp. HY1533]|uniref:peptidase M56 family protein n=1 Tax=Arthrobacter sp. HY1533 TaxID=2970919 RepID=UPI0022BA0A28|nr:peptidase M56 family protein [Arthrobacter sp. HY1533]
MNQQGADDTFSKALRRVLVSRVEESALPRMRRRRRLWMGAGVFAGAGLLGGIGAAAAGILTLPGGDAVTPLAAPVTGSYTGSATVDLGPIPEGVTNVAIELTCLSPGRLAFEDGASIVCSDSDVGTGSFSGGYSIPVSAGQHTITITADPAARWSLKASYVRQTTTEWGTNARGESYGVQNGNGTPDLIAVVASNGKVGYARSAELDNAGGADFKSPEEAIAWQNEHKGKSVSVPVYESDGTTRVGEFILGGP